MTTGIDNYCETIKEIHRTLDTSSVDKFTYSFIDSSWDELDHTLHALERLPEAVFRELIQVIEGLRDARDELRLARFLFDVEEINAVHRLILRNRAVARGKAILRTILQVWPNELPA